MWLSSGNYLRTFYIFKGISVGLYRMSNLVSCIALKIVFSPARAMQVGHKAFCNDPWQVSTPQTDCATRSEWYAFLLRLCRGAPNDFCRLCGQIWILHGRCSCDRRTSALQIMQSGHDSCNYSNAHHCVSHMTKMPQATLLHKRLHWIWVYKSNLKRVFLYLCVQLSVLSRGTIIHTA